LFHAGIASSIGIDPRGGKAEDTMGVSGKVTRVYLHRVSIYTAGGMEAAVVGFCENLPVAGLLGRRGFLDRFRFTYDSSTSPPQFEIVQVVRT
jgi:hypothetical protein